MAERPAVLFHFSEAPTIPRFAPRSPREFPGLPPVVWAIDAEHAPHYYFPRDCPRVVFWATPQSTPADVTHFLAHTAARKVIAIEGGWLDRLRQARLYAYHLPGDTFTLFDEAAGYHISYEPVTPLTVESLGDLLARLVASGVELRLTPSLWPLRQALPQSSLGFSMIRLRNAVPE